MAGNPCGRFGIPIWMFRPEIQSIPTSTTQESPISDRRFLIPNQPPILSSFYHHHCQRQNPHPHPKDCADQAELKNLPRDGDVFANWKILKILGEGGYGCIYKAINQKTERIEAVKVEKARARRPLLKIETLILKRLQGTNHVSQFVTSGVTGHGVRYLVMELLGPNISSLRKKSRTGRFGYSTGLRTARQMLASIRNLHQVGYLHRDIKMSNFAIALPPNHRKICIFDFGLGRQYCDFNGEIRPPRYPAGFRGTLRYCSPHVLRKHEQDRRDDLISLMYMIAEMLRGPLPWRHCMEREEVKDIKCSITKHILLQGLPKQLFVFYDHLFQLQYGDAPDYKFLDGVLEEVLMEFGMLNDEHFQWETETDSCILPSEANTFKQQSNPYW